MADKVGRNAPCPCGSGKKYKKCCGFNKVPDFSLPEDTKTGTILDEYMMLFQGIAIFGKGLRQFDSDKKSLNATVKDFEKRFRPGKPNGVSDGVYMTWYHLDLRFGKQSTTVCERFIKSGYVDKLRDPGPILIRNMSRSYLTFYEVKNVLDDWLIFEEIGTGKKWKIHRINEPFEREARVADVWYVRFLGYPEEGYIYTAPYIIPYDGVADRRIFEAMLTQKNTFARYAEENMSEDDIFIESCKAAVRFWVEGFLMERGNHRPSPA